MYKPADTVLINLHVCDVVSDTLYYYKNKIMLFNQISFISAAVKSF